MRFFGKSWSWHLVADVVFQKPFCCRCMFAGRLWWGERQTLDGRWRLHIRRVVRFTVDCVSERICFVLTVLMVLQIGTYRWPQPVIIGASMQSAMHIHMQISHSYNRTWCQHEFLCVCCCVLLSNQCVDCRLGSRRGHELYKLLHRLFDMVRIFCNPLLVLSSFI